MPASFTTLRHDVVAAFRYDGHVAQSELQQVVTAARVVDYVDRFEIDIFARKNAFTRRRLLQPGWVKRTERSEVISIWIPVVVCGNSRARRMLLRSGYRTTNSSAALAYFRQRIAAY